MAELIDAEKQEKQERAFQKRSPAVISSISEIVNGKFVKEEGFTPNYVKTAFGEKISRANIIGSVVSKDLSQQQSPIVLVDDGTEKITVRSFDNPGVFNNAEVGDAVIVIGKPREFGNENYIAVEILKKLNSLRWAEVRQLELKNKYETLKSENASIKDEIKPEEPITEQGEVADSEEKNQIKNILNLISGLDKGKGAEISELIKKYNLDENETQSQVVHLLKRGDIFELRPGVLKVLE